ncbi:phosphoribosyltransferase family protein, partial [Streptococcus suis]
MLDKDIKKILVSEEEIVAKCKELGQILANDYADKNPILVGILKGSIPFMAELMKHIDAHIETDYMVVS